MIDRFSDQDTAILLVEQIGKEFIVKIEQLPKGVNRGDYLILEIEDNQIQSIDKDQERTKERQLAIKSKLDMLGKRKGNSRFRK